MEAHALVQFLDLISIPNKLNLLILVNPISNIFLTKVLPSRRTGRFEATVQPSRLSEVDAILLCVPTPLDDHRVPGSFFVLGTTCIGHTKWITLKMA